MKRDKISVLSNEGKVLSLLCKEKLTRSEIAEKTGLRYSSITYITLKLESLGLIRIAGTKKVKKGPLEDVYEITEKGIQELREELNKEWRYIDVLLQLKETKAVPVT